MSINNTQAFDAKRLIGWYEQFVRPLFEKTLPLDTLTGFDKDRDQLSDLLSISDTEIAICFLGTSGIGKSTLINAIVGGSDVILPSGGVGPLTAQALIVRSMSEGSRLSTMTPGQSCGQFSVWNRCIESR